MSGRLVLTLEEQPKGYMNFSVTTAASVVFILLSLPLCTCLQACLTALRPMHFRGTFQTCHSSPVHKMPSDFPTNPGHLTPTSTCSLVRVPKSSPPVDTPASRYLISQSFSVYNQLSRHFPLQFIILCTFWLSAWYVLAAFWPAACWWPACLLFPSGFVFFFTAFSCQTVSL